MIEPSLEDADFVQGIHSPEFLPWGQVIFSVGQTRYRYVNGWIKAATEAEIAAAQEWAAHNRIDPDLSLDGMTFVPGHEQWLSISHSERLEARAAEIFGIPFKGSPHGNPRYNSTVIGACRDKQSGASSLAVIQFSPPPPFFIGVHRLNEFEFFPSPYAVTLPEFRRQRELAYEMDEGSEVVNLDAGDGASYIRMPAPFYTWPKEGPLPMLGQDEALNRKLIPSFYEFSDVTLFFAWF